MVWRHYGPHGLASLFRRFTLWRMPGRWWALLLLGMPAVFYAGAAVTGNAGDFPFDPWYGVLPALIPAFFIGPIEELGWRGVALPLLQRRFAPLWASLIVGVVAALWHTPAFLMSGTKQAAWSFAPFFLGVVAISVILTAMFNASQGSLLVAALFHATMNGPAWPDAQPWDMLGFVLVAAVVVWFNREQHAHPRHRRHRRADARGRTGQRTNRWKVESRDALPSGRRRYLKHRASAVMLMAHRVPAAPAGHEIPSREQGPAGQGWRILAALEVAAAAAAVVADLFVPTLVLLGMASISLLLRRRGLGSLGLHRPPHGWLLAAQMLAFAIAWTLLSLALIIPVANHVTGQRQDMSDFADLEGDLGLLAVLLVASWTLAAFGEELAFRGYLLTRLTDTMGTSRAAGVVAVLTSSLLFGLLHTQQGVVGVVLTTLDGVVFALLRFRLGTVWAPVLAHGFNNTIGFIAFFIAGPVYGLW